MTTPMLRGKMGSGSPMEDDGELVRRIAAAPREAADIDVRLEPLPQFEEEVVVSASRSPTRIQDQPLRVEVIDREEIEEKALMTPGSVAMLIGETTGLRVQPTAPSLGAANVRKDLAFTKRHPTIEDNVIIYSGSTILGGTTVIGHDTIVGGNVWLTESVLPFSVVYHKSEVHVRNEKLLDGAPDFVI